MSTSSPTPRSGCLIMGLIGAMLVGGVSWTVYTGWRQSRIIAAFTSETPGVFPAVAADQARLSALDARIGVFAGSLRNREQAELRLDVGEINLFLASNPAVADYRDMVRVREFLPEKQTISCDINMPMNSFPGQPRRFLVGGAEAKFSRAEAQLWLTLVAVTVPGREVEKGFVTNLSSWNWLAALPEEAKALVQQITETRVEKDVLILRSGATVPAVDDTPGS